MNTKIRHLLALVLVLTSFVWTTPAYANQAPPAPNPVPLLPDLAFKLGSVRGVPVLLLVNQGNAPAKQFTVTVDTYNPYATQTINYSVAIRQLDPGKSYNVGFVTALQLPDSPCFKARADVYQTVVEANESNNQLISSGPVNLPCYVTWPG
jgi:hypothetical protein